MMDGGKGLGIKHRLMTFVIASMTVRLVNRDTHTLTHTQTHTHTLTHTQLFFSSWLRQLRVISGQLPVPQHLPKYHGGRRLQGMKWHVQGLSSFKVRLSPRALVSRYSFSSLQQSALLLQRWTFTHPVPVGTLLSGLCICVIFDPRCASMAWHPAGRPVPNGFAGDLSWPLAPEENRLPRGGGQEEAKCDYVIFECLLTSRISWIKIIYSNSIPNEILNEYFQYI